MSDAPIGFSSGTPAYNAYKFSVYRNGAQTLTAGSFTKMNFDTKLFDTSSNFDATTNFQFTAPVAGFYYFSSGVNTGAAATITQVLIAIFKNGSEFKRGNQITAGNNVQGSVVSGLLQLSANDTVDIRVDAVGGNAPVSTGSSQSYFDGFLVSAA